MLNALLVANPGSGASRRLSRQSIPGRWLEDPAALTAADLEGVDLLALFGGDGTMQITLTGLLNEMAPERLPPIALLPFGTTNMNASDLNRARGAAAAVASLVTAVETGMFERQQRRLVRVAGNDAPQYGFFFGAGVIADVIERWNQGRKSGPLTNQLRSLWAMASGLRSAGAAHRMVLDGRQLEVYGLMATTLERLLFGSRPYWGCGAADDLHLTWVAADAPGLLRRAPALLRGDPRLADAPGYDSIATGQATLELDGPYVLDGEIYTPTHPCLSIERSAPLSWAVL